MLPLNQMLQTNHYLNQISSLIAARLTKKSLSNSLPWVKQSKSIWRILTKKGLTTSLNRYQLIQSWPGELKWYSNHSKAPRRERRQRRETLKESEGKLKHLLFRITWWAISRIEPIIKWLTRRLSNTSMMKKLMTTTKGTLKGLAQARQTLFQYLLNTSY